MANQIDKTLINTLSKLAREEKRINGFRDRVRLKGKIKKKGKTKKGNIRLKIEEGENVFNFVVIKTHKERFALAEQLKVGSFVSAAGIRRFRAVICTQLKQLHKMDGSRQETLSAKN